MKRDSCIACKYFLLDLATDGYSDWTPGEEAAMLCLKNKWYWGFHERDHRGKLDIKRKLYELLHQAKDCPEFEFADYALEEESG